MDPDRLAAAVEWIAIALAIGVVGAPLIVAWVYRKEDQNGPGGLDIP